jgi:hypothetical protein
MVEGVLLIAFIILGWLLNYTTYQIMLKGYSNSIVKIGYGVLSIIPYFTGLAIAFIVIGIFIFELILAFGNSFLEIIKNYKEKRK